MAVRTPGPIAAAQPLLAALDEYRQLHLALTEADATHPWLPALELPTELELEAVAEVELLLAASFSDALLATLASRVPHLEEAFELQLALLPQLSEEARAVGCPVDMLAVAREADGFFCVPRREQPWASTMVTPWHPLDGAEVARALPRWLRDTPMADLREVLRALQAVEAGQEAPPGAARVEVGTGLVPRLVAREASVVPTAPRVSHPKFGAGRVLRALGEGAARKLEIEFDEGGVRTILARFVNELAPGG